MMKRLIIILMMRTGFAWAGGDHAHTEPAEDMTVEAATFKEGVGITLGDETRQAIGLTLAEVADGVLVPDRRMTAQIYRTAAEASQNSGERRGYAYASAILTPAAADALQTNSPITIAGLVITGQVVAVERAMLMAADRCEVLIEIPDPEARLAIGDFIQAQPTGGQALTVVRVPRPAILNSADGTYVYTQNGDALLRTAVATGASNATHVEIIDGLYTGDVVAASAVETLYLIELRATKGGGHCH